MDAIRILEKPDQITWDYDEEADVLYLSIGEPRPAVGVDIGDGLSYGMTTPARKSSA